MPKLGTNFKVCQTCRYWNGSRNVDGFSKLVENFSNTGKCNNLKGHYNQEMSHQATCPHHEPII